MKYRKCILPLTFVFTKWKREGYAVFASLRKLIKIGTLSVATCQRFFLENGIKLNFFPYLIINFCTEEIPDHESGTGRRRFLPFEVACRLTTYKISRLFFCPVAKPIPLQELIINHYIP